MIASCLDAWTELTRENRSEALRIIRAEIKWRVDAARESRGERTASHDGRCGGAAGRRQATAGGGAMRPARDGRARPRDGRLMGEHTA